jgi:hypothetical protein
MLVALFLLAFLFFGGHWVYIVLVAGLHPLHLLVQVLAIVLLYHLGRRLVDQIGKGQS